MDRKEVIVALHKCKKLAGLDYALASGAGDCITCTNAILSDRYGENAKGIWLKFYTFGMNRREWDDGTQYIVHDLTEEQAKKVVEILSEKFQVDWDGDPCKCIAISNKVVEKC